MYQVLRKLSKKFVAPTVCTRFDEMEEVSMDTVTMKSTMLSVDIPVGDPSP